MTTFTPMESATLSSIAAAAKDLDVSHGKMHYKALFTNDDGTQLILNYTNVVDKYFDFLQKIIVEYTMTDKEFLQYKYQPKRMSQDMYGTTELWAAILRINGMVSLTQFNKQTVKLFTQDIFDFLNEIMIIEGDRLKSPAVSLHNK
jgi:hypothetical protein